MGWRYSLKIQYFILDTPQPCIFSTGRGKAAIFGLVGSGEEGVSGRAEDPGRVVGQRGGGVVHGAFEMLSVWGRHKWKGMWRHVKIRKLTLKLKWKFILFYTVVRRICLYIPWNLYVLNNCTMQVPFEYAEFKFCAVKCLKEHRAKSATTKK